MADKLVVCCSIVEDQDSSGEGGLSSNWWILGSQGRDSLSTAGDTTLQTLPRSALSAPGAQNSAPKSPTAESKYENAAKSGDEQTRRDSREASDEGRKNRNSEKQTDGEAEKMSGRSKPIKEQEKEKQKREHNEKTEDASVDEGNITYTWVV